MKRLILALGIIITMALTVMAQGVDGIKRNSSYLYGEGGGVTLQAAKEAALADLIQKISVTVHSDFTSKERELNQDGNVTSDAEYQSIIRSYSTATLTNVKTIVLKPEPDASVFLYIAKSEIDRIFESRVAKAKEFVGNADEALKNGQIDDALRYYYWSYCLVKSLRYPNEAKIFVDGQERSLLAWLPTRIDDVMGKVKVQSRRTADNTYEITATYDGRPVRSMDYTYFDGVDNSPVYSILDGKGLVELRPGMAMDAVQLKLEYEFRGLSRNDSEVEAVVGAMKPAVYRRAYHRVALDGAASPAESTSTDVNGSMQSPLALTNMGTLGTAVMKPVMQALRSGSIEQCRQKFTAEGWEEFSKLMGYGKVTLMDDIHLDYFADGDCVVCRGLPVSCRFNRGRVFNEKLSFYIDSNSKQITHVAMGLGREAMNDVVLGHLDWSEKSRTRIVGFLEDYRTAYATKNLEYLDKVFDDNAVIVLGKRLQVAPQLNKEGYMNNHRVQFTQLTKREFLRNLRRQFQSKDYINLHFSQNRIYQLQKGVERYGIEIKQDYYSSNYGDTGYLTLIFDLTNPDQPVIHVRTWQEQPDPNFGVVSPADF
ncbi:MAG: LPP20 family lipoprotein [Muribaculaceae bacterium]|nr:LPP20 family lipoprotein [Muribaculaceae bacterium]